MTDKIALATQLNAELREPVATFKEIAEAAIDKGDAQAMAKALRAAMATMDVLVDVVTQTLADAALDERR